MSSAKVPSEAINTLPFLQETQVPFSKGEDKLFDSEVPGDIPNFNDSNSDDTQCELHGGDLNSNDTSPVKETLVQQRIRNHENSEPTKNHVKQESVPCDSEEVNDKAMPSNKSTSLSNADVTSFVDYFLAHDDLLQALDDYSRSVGQTSVFPLQMAPALSMYDDYCDPKDLCNPSSSLHVSNISQTNSIAMNNQKNHEGERSDGVTETSNCDKRTESSKQPRGKERLGTKQQKCTAMPRRSEKRKPRTYSQAVPSQHCHICSRRPTEMSPHAVCGNLLKGRCRKTICTKCFHQFRWDLKAAREAPPGSWQCPHCRGECPQRAQCVIYNRTSDRRRMKMINHRKKKDQTKVSATRKYQMNSKGNGKTESPGTSPDTGTTMVHPCVTPNSSSSSQTARSLTNLSQSEKVCLESNGISKPMRTSGVSPLAQFMFMGEEFAHRVISGGKGQNEWDGSGTIDTPEMMTLELAPQVERFEQGNDVELKRDVELPIENDLKMAGGSHSEDLTGILDSIGLDNDVMNSSEDAGKETGMDMSTGKGNDEMNTNLALLDIEEPFGRNKGDSGCDQGRFWGDDEVDCEEMPVEEFGINESGLGLDALA